MLKERDVGILGVGVYIPPQVMTYEEIVRRALPEEKELVAKSGINRKHIAAEDVFTSDMVVAAAREALEASGSDAAELGLILTATDTKELGNPNTGALAQPRLLGETLEQRPVRALDIGDSGCAGFVMGLELAVSWVQTHSQERVVLIGAELISKMIDWGTEHAFLFGDAAGAVVLGEVRDETPWAGRIIATSCGTDGTKAHILGQTPGGTRRPFSEEVLNTGEHRKLHMEGSPVFRAAVKQMSRAMNEVLDKGGVGREQVRLLIPHQANQRIIETMARKLGISDEEVEERVLINIGEYGNTGSASVVVGLWEALQQGRIKEGDYVVITAFGAGFHWGAALLQF